VGPVRVIDVPASFELSTVSTGSIVAAVGGGLFALAYIPSLALGGAGALVCRGDCSPSPAYLLIHAVGFFVLASKIDGPSHDGGNGGSLLLVDGAVQTGGLILVVAGLVLDAKTTLVPDEEQVGGVRVRPSVAAGTTGVVLGGTF